MAPILHPGDIVINDKRHFIVVGYMPHDSGLSDEMFLFDPEYPEKLVACDANELVRVQNIARLPAQYRVVASALKLESLLSGAIERRDRTAIEKLIK